MKNLIKVFVVLACLFYSTIPVFTFQQINYTFKGNFQRTGYINANIRRNSAKTWIIEDIPYIKEIDSINNSLIILTKKGEIISFNEITKEKIWIYKTYSEITSRPTYCEGKLYFGTLEGRLVCLDWLTGRELWSYPLFGSIRTSPLVIGNSLIVGSENGKLYSFDRISGRKLWDYNVYSAIESSPATYQNCIYFGSSEGNFYCLTKDGNLEWKFNTDETIISTPAIADEYITLTTYEGGIYCLNKYGKLLWKKRISPYVISSPATYEGIVYQTFSDGKLYAFDIKNGSTLWFSALQKSNSTPIITNELLVYESSSKWLNLIDRRNGKLVSQYEEIGEGIIDYAISQNSIFILTGTGKIIKYETF
jgi:outer membrane protein assembly factor BamB